MQQLDLQNPNNWTLNINDLYRQYTKKQQQAPMASRGNHFRAVSVLD